MALFGYFCVLKSTKIILYSKFSGVPIPDRYASWVLPVSDELMRALYSLEEKAKSKLTTKTM